MQKKTGKKNNGNYRSISNPRPGLNSKNYDYNKVIKNNKRISIDCESEKNIDNSNNKKVNQLSYRKSSLDKTSKVEKLPLIKSHEIPSKRLSIVKFNGNNYSNDRPSLVFENDNKNESYKEKLANINVLRVNKAKNFVNNNSGFDNANERGSFSSLVGGSNNVVKNNNTTLKQIEYIKKSGTKLKIAKSLNKNTPIKRFSSPVNNDSTNVVNNLNKNLGENSETKCKKTLQRNLSDINLDSITKEKALDKFEKTEENIDSEFELIKSCEFLSRAGKGDDGKTKTNQDSYLINKKINGFKNFHMFGILDGHGLNGHFASSLSVQFLKNYFNNDKELKELKTMNEIYKKLKQNHYQIIKTAFRRAEKELSLSTHDFSFSGTTCVIVFIVGKKIICANAGDSRAILVSQNISNNEYNVKALSRDHKPNLIAEKKRIESKGGAIEKFISNGQEFGPYRVWVKGEGFPGLAMSRSIGDLIASQIGVEPEAEIKEFEINDQSKYIIIASDGVWEFLNNSNVMNMTKKFYEINDNKKLCQHLVKESVKSWEKDDTVIDDITCVSIFF